MAIPAPRFKPLGHAASYLVMFRFTCNRIERPRKSQESNPESQHKETAMIDRQVDMESKDAKTSTFIPHPERRRPFPVILFYMDAPASREELRDMARRF